MKDFLGGALAAILLLALQPAEAAPRDNCHILNAIFSSCETNDAARSKASSDDGSTPEQPGDNPGPGKGKGNNGHGNDPDGNDSSNPGNSNNGDGTDADGSPGKGGGKKK